MLVLSRKTEQKIQLGNDVTITILKITDGVVRIGIDAPQSVRILRAELADKQRAVQKAAPASDATLATQSQATQRGPSRLKLRVEESSRPEEPAPPQSRSIESRPTELRSAQSRFAQQHAAPERTAQSPAPGDSRPAGSSARRAAPQSVSPRCRVPRAGFNSPGRHPLRVGPASVADGMVAGVGQAARSNET